MLALFPFEPPIYEAHSIPVRYVGHPLADEIAMRTDRDAARARLGLDPGARIVALLPAAASASCASSPSRWPATARWVHHRRPGVRFVAPLVNGPTRDRLLAGAGRARPRIPCDLFIGASRDAMAASDAVLLASGTATLEALLLKRPMVITYRTMRLTWTLGRAMVHIDHYGLPNLLAGTRLVPELMQDDAIPERLGPALLERLDHPGRQRRVLEEFDRIHRTLRNDAFEKAAEAVLEVAAA